MEKQYTREFEQKEVDNIDNIVSFSIASSAPYERYDKSLGGAYDEVLVISNEAIDFTRLVDGRCPFLVGHDHEKQIGVVDKAYIVGEKLYVDVRFSDNKLAQAMLKDIKAGIRRNTSVGYNILDYDMTVVNGKPTMICKRWLPYEASTVSVPADYLVRI